MPGDTISHYEVGEKIGEGGMGVVYKAIDRKLDRQVALKFLPHHLSSSPDIVHRFRQEANAISRLNHPNIATIYALEDDGDQTFLSLEYVTGGTLKHRIEEAAAEGRMLPWHEILKIARRTGEGLAHAHRRGIVHRDVKTANILLCEDGTPKLTDFGLAKLADHVRNTRSGALLGTVAYMSPEQAQGMEVDQRSDIFSFGVVLFEMATGRLPFEAPNDFALLSEIVHTPAPSICKYRPDASARI
jgi:serine/threonine protein kinase